jgi:hypothetical protein
MTPEHQAIIDRIRSSAGAVRRALEAAPPTRLGVAPRAGEWSALETLTHLRDVVVHVQGLRIRRLLYEAAPVFADFDEEGYRRASLARGETVEYLLGTIVGEHEQLARLLEGLPARRHVDRVPRPAGGRARRGARRADRCGDAGGLRGCPVSGRRETSAPASPGWRPRPRARPRP